ncbi:MAG: AraC family transcriptional regulator ligand-binding domain-containing protein [Polyangiales bacterium]
MPSSAPSSISARLIQPLLREWEAGGRDLRVLEKRLGVDLELTARIDGRIAYEMWADVRLFCVEETKDPSFPLRATERLDARSLPLELYLVGSQPTLREGARYAMPFGSSLVDGLAVHLAHDGQSGFADFRRHDEPFYPPELAEYFLLCLWRFTRLVAPASPPARAVTFTHRFPRHGSSLEEFFGAPVHLGAAEVGFRFELPNVELPVASADPGLGQLLAHRAQAQLAENTAAFTLRDRARHWLRANLRGDDALGARLAKAMKLSERSLRRQLAEQDSSVRALVDDARRERAIELMERGKVNLDAIAEELGYGNAAAFGRAFRRWTGQTPSAFLEQRRGH